TLAIERPGAIALAASPPLIFFLRIISPVRVLLDMFNNTLFRVLHLKMAGKTETSMEEDLKVLLFSGEFDGLLEEDERDMIDGVFEMGEMTVNEVMTPRTDLEAFPITLSQEQMIAAVRGATHSRALIYEEDIDHVVGFLHVKDLFLSPQKRFRELIRPPFLVPEKKELTDLLTEMQRRRTHIAVVVDEYGGVAGVVTLNDVLAEIVGDIRDSNEAKETKDIIRVGKDHYNVAGMAELFDINETLGTSFDEDVARTISGFICNSLGRLPESGEECLIEGWRFKILKMEGNRVERIVMRMQSGAPAAGNDDHTIPQGGDHSRDGY
ncbi:MAG TPA: hemolysin family protein, partial [Candidatus Sumerlaeota bacterium]|nr:hemolysin family protein [Candidatus Sumerlaeota bacterium]